MEFAFWLVIIFALVYEPIFGYFDFQRFKLDVKTRRDARSRYYRNAIISLWLPTVFILLIVVFTDLTLANIGLTLPTIHTVTFGPVMIYLVFALAFFYLVGILYYLIGYRMSDKIRLKLLKAKQKEKDHSKFSVMLPTTKKEKRLWNYVSLTAGITEEMIYRGFLIYAFSFLFPNLSYWIIVLFSSILFGLAHTSQGMAGVLRTSIIGFLFSILSIGLGSILPVMFFHYLIDYFAKVGEPETAS